MTLYYSLVFALLCAEMLTFCLLILPLPFAAKKSMLSFLATNRIVGKIQYGLKITFIFVAILAVDSIQRMWRVVAEGQRVKAHPAGMAQAQSDSSFAARKFYAERNVYLCVFTLFLFLCLSRTFVLMLDLVDAQQRLGESNTSKGKQPSAVLNTEIKQLKDKLAAKDRDLETLKKQFDSNMDALNVGSAKSNKKAV